MLVHFKGVKVELICFGHVKDKLGTTIIWVIRQKIVNCYRTKTIILFERAKLQNFFMQKQRESLSVRPAG